jgi:hypothetical protein
MYPVLGARRMPGPRWYRHQPGLTCETRSVFSYPCPQPQWQWAGHRAGRGGGARMGT